jgi:SAM-dependent methyltransferase
MKNESEVLKSCISLHWLRPDNALWVFSFYQAFAETVQHGLARSSRTVDLGCGDGTTSFVMLDGVFGPGFDAFMTVQADEQNIVPDIRRSESGSLSDSSGDFYNSYDERWSRYLSIEHAPEWRYGIGLDWKESLLKKCQDLGIYDRLVPHDANTALPFSDESQDFLFSTIVYWLRDTQHSLQEAARVLQPGGVFAFSAPDENINGRTLESLIGSYGYPGLEVLDRGRNANWARHAQSKENWETQIAAAGLKIVEYRRFHSALQIMFGETTIRPLLRAYQTLYKNLLPDHQDIFMEFKSSWTEEIYRLLEPFADPKWMSADRQEMVYHAFVVQKS